MRPRELSSSAQWMAVRTPTLPPATHTNSFALGTRDVLLVEPATPYEEEQRAWIEWVRALGTTGRRPVAILVTHHHADHVGGAEALSRELGLPIWGHPETLTRLAPSLRTEPVVDEQRIVLEGPTPTRLEVLHTPGHAPGHVCLFDRDARLVVVGDMVASVGTILIAPGDGHMKTYLDQLARLERLDATVALPAHGEPIDAPSALFARYRAHRLMREEKTFDALPEDGTFAAADALVPVAYDDTPMAVWPIALLSLRAHLEKLVEDGRVAVRDEKYARVLPEATVPSVTE